MIVVSDTSPILNLGRIGRLDLLPALFTDVVVPMAVYAELTAFRDDLPRDLDLAAIEWMKVAVPTDWGRVERLSEGLDPGEAEAIALALEHGADLLLIDERRGRRVATESGIRVSGLLGIIVRAKREGLIDLARPLLDDLIGTARFWIGPTLYARVLAELDE